MLKRDIFFFDKDAGAGSTPTPELTPTPAEPPEKNEDKVVFTPEQQIQLDKIVGGARQKAREQAKTELETAQAEAKKKSDEAVALKKLEDEKEFQKVIELGKTKIAEIEPALKTAQEQVTAYEELAAGILKQRVETFGDQAQTAIDNLPGEPDTLAKLSWLSANEDLFKPTTPAPKGTPPKTGVPSPTLQQKEKEAGIQEPAMNIGF